MDVVFELAAEVFAESFCQALDNRLHALIRWIHNLI